MCTLVFVRVCVCVCEREREREREGGERDIPYTGTEKGLN